METPMSAHKMDMMVHICNPRYTGHIELCPRPALGKNVSSYVKNN
jgi:hypothetical protein